MATSLVTNTLQPLARSAAIDRTRRLAATVGLILCMVAFWMLQHPFEGLVHDSLLYSLGALARVHPESLGHDVFLSVGSQDRFTVFSPLAASLIRLIGLERTAATITFIAHVAFFGSAWLLARRLMTPAAAGLAVAFLIVLPSAYGAKHIFSYAEPFMTPRLPAEALVLAALAAAFAGRRALAGICFLAAALLHPIMAVPGIVLLFTLYVGLTRPGLAACIVAAGFGAIALVAWVLPFGPVSHFSDGWFQLLFTRAQYLFASQWPAEDYEHAVVPLTVLLIGGFTVTDTTLRAICRAALITALAGLLVTYVGADLLRIVLFAQLQSWRWLWLANMLAALLTPLILASCWRAGNASRATALLIVAAWICIDENFAPAVALLAIGSCAASRYVTDPARGRLLLFGSVAVTLMSVAVFVGFVQGVLKALSTVAPDPSLYDSHYLLAVRHWKPWVSGGVVPAGILFLVWWLGTRRADRKTGFAILAFGIVLFLGAAPFGWNAWTRIDYPDREHAAFAEWRRQIPPTAQVLWLSSPFPVWYLLERPSYWSTSQMAASVFSEEMARELARRERIMIDQNATSDARGDLALICRNNPSLAFFVSPFDMGPSPFSPVALDGHVGRGTVRLYRCADYRT